MRAKGRANGTDIIPIRKGRANGSAASTPIKVSDENLTIEQRDNLIVALSRKVANLQGELSETRALLNVAQITNLELSKRIPAEPAKIVGQCMCGDSALVHYVKPGENKHVSVLGSCMRASCRCRKYVDNGAQK